MLHLGLHSAAAGPAVTVMDECQCLVGKCFFFPYGGLQGFHGEESKSLAALCAKRVSDSQELLRFSLFGAVGFSENRPLK